MLKIITVSFFTLSLAAIGCGSSTPSKPNTTGGAGTTGSAGVTGSSGSTGEAGFSGSAGSTGEAGTTGAAGVTGEAGTTGTAGTTGEAGAGGRGGSTGTAGTGGSQGSGGTTGKDGGTDGSVAKIPKCTSTKATSPAMSPTTFCEIFLSVCGTGHTGYMTQAECLATYGALHTTKPMREMCQSYHLCNADAASGAARTLHCTHAAGEVLCTQNN